MSKVQMNLSLPWIAHGGEPDRLPNPAVPQMFEGDDSQLRTIICWARGNKSRRSIVRYGVRRVAQDSHTN